MKMAKASEADIDMAIELANFLEAIERGHMPDTLCTDDDCVEWIDTTGNEQYDRLIDGLKGLLNQGSISRVIWGMAVVCDPSNECIDPDADTIEHHPKRQQIEKQNAEMLARLDVVCEVGVISPAYDRIRAERQFAIDDLEYDLFAAGWKKAIASVKGSPQ